MHWRCVVPVRVSISCARVCSNAAGDASYCFAFAEAVSSTHAVYTDTDGLSLHHTVLLAIGIAAVWALLNALRVDQQGWLNNVAALYQVRCMCVDVPIIARADIPKVNDAVFLKCVLQCVHIGTLCCPAASHSGEIALAGSLRCPFRVRSSHSI